ncbi:hypothetical protein [Clostridium akagii]|nr:hypothetical protein [Clostridium akagii]
MPTVAIVRPNITQEQEEKAFKGVARVIEKIIFEEYGIKAIVKIKEKVN